MKKILILYFLFLYPFSIFALNLDDYTLIYDSYQLEYSGKIPLALDKMIQIHKKNRNHYLVNLRLGWLFNLDKKTKNAEEHYLKAADIAPESIEPWLGLSKIFLDLGQWKTAINYSEEILKRDPQNYFGNLRFIQASIQRRNFSQALDKLKSILLTYPLDTIFLEQKAFCLDQLNRSSEAKKAVLDLLLVSPQNEYGKSFMNKNK